MIQLQTSFILWTFMLIECFLYGEFCFQVVLLNISQHESSNTNKNMLPLDPFIRTYKFIRKPTGKTNDSNFILCKSAHASICFRLK
jgi:hypothetical protein